MSASLAAALPFFILMLTLMWVARQQAIERQLSRIRELEAEVERLRGGADAEMGPHTSDDDRRA